MNLQASQKLASTAEDGTLALAASTTAAISDEFAATGAGMASGLRIDIEYTATVAAAITLKLQHKLRKLDGTDVWSDLAGARAQTTLATNASPAIASILLNPFVAADAAAMPLRSSLRVVAVSGAGDSASFRGVTVFEPGLDGRLQGATRSI